MFPIEQTEELCEASLGLLSYGWYASAQVTLTLTVP